ncbi:MAG: PEP-CTERM sorting domain-containing protein [Pirellulaceae bacterium]
MTLVGHEGGAGTNVYLDGTRVARTNQGGLFYWSSSSPEAQAFLPNSDSFLTFCIELTQDIAFGQPYEYNIIDMATAPMPGSNGTPMGDTGARLIRELWYSHIDDATSSGMDAAGYTAAQRQGAFQMSIWELVYDEGVEIDLSSGLLTASNTDETTLATQWLNELGNAEDGFTYGNQASLAALTSNTRQDQLVEVEAAPVPEPSSLLAFAGLGMCFGAGSWWRRRRKPAA